MIRLLAFLLVAGGLGTYAFWIYRRVELPVPRWRLLAGARAATLVLLALLLFDPRLPWGEAGADGGRWALLDVSSSMVAGAPGARAWDAARARADELERAGWRVVPFGPGREEVADSGASASRTVLGPALERALESGARQVRVLSDFRLEDPVEVTGVLATAGSPAVTFETFGTPGPHAGVVDFRVDDAPRRGDPMVATLDVIGEGVADSVAVTIHEEDREVAAVKVAAPGPGLRRTVRLELPAPEGEGRIRYSARVETGGAEGYPADDEAVAYATVGYSEGALVLVALAVDWESRYLLPVLEQVSGLRGVAYARTGPDRFTPMGRAAQRGPSVDSATVRRAVDEAALVVVHGLGGGTDAWGASLASRAERLVAWPSDAEGASALGLAVSGTRQGEWYVAADLPASPVAAELAGGGFEGLPPLSGLLAVEGSGASAVALRAQLGGTGPGVPALLLTTSAAGRRAVPLAGGMWRWAAREGAPRETYRRLWSSVAGWLLAQDGTRAPDVRPVAWVVEAGRPVRWRVPAGVGEVGLTLSRNGDPVADTTLLEGDAVTDGLPAGTYGYRAVDPQGDLAGEGRFDVSASNLEMAWAVAQAPPSTTPEGGEGGAPLLRAGGRPLRTSPWPYLLVLALLCTEWIGRRRAGLR